MESSAARRRVRSGRCTPAFHHEDLVPWLRELAEAIHTPGETHAHELVPQLISAYRVPQV